MEREEMVQAASDALAEVTEEWHEEWPIEKIVRFILDAALGPEND